jgi:UDP-N-acetylmuramyl pentapeptide phosphotransferase/UDP-N-acetylglucosamine-1-phosphate transferase
VIRTGALGAYAVPFAVAAVTTACAAASLERLIGKHLLRTNFRGRQVSLAAGPAVTSGLFVAAVVMPSTRVAAATAVAVTAAGLAGGYDDAASRHQHERAVKGFRGHLSAARVGRPSAGVVKVIVIGIGAAAASMAAGRRNVVDLTVDSALVAGTANLVNLLDLRPGRAAKAALATAVVATPGAAGAYRSVGAAVAGGALAVLPSDLSERCMLGDSGANPLGAALGLLLCGQPRRRRIACLAGILGLTGASERVSFSAVIDGNPLLARLDQLGRRP